MIFSADCAVHISEADPSGNTPNRAQPGALILQTTFAAELPIPIRTIPFRLPIYRTSILDSEQRNPVTKR